VVACSQRPLLTSRGLSAHGSGDDHLARGPRLFQFGVASAELCGRISSADDALVATGLAGRSAALRCAQRATMQKVSRPHE